MSMRFVWVNDKLKPMKAFCAFDHAELRDGYIRELATGLLYHGAHCLQQHAFVCQEMVSEAKASKAPGSLLRRWL
jgi:hypothetical protein